MSPISDVHLADRIWSYFAYSLLKIIFLTNKDIDLKVKGSVYVALCSSILLYGSEIWCLREDLFNRLRRFHHRCARTMRRITIAHTIRHRISSARLFLHAFQLSPSTRIIIVDFFDGQAMSPECH
jgi:hypothetical protein